MINNYYLVFFIVDLCSNKLSALEEIIDLKDSIGISAEQIDIPFVLLNFFACVLISFIVRKFYINFSHSLTGKHHIGSIIPTLSSVVFLIIIIVKSSLALSLGLVGALSIVRFRTPIKEPEELVYLFLAIAIGLGFGAGYSLITTILSLLILLSIYIFLFKKKNFVTNEYNLLIERKSSDIELDNIINTLTSHCNTIKLIRIDSGTENQTIVFSITLNKESSITEIISGLKALSKMEISFFESKANW
jgi:hypothetical protein